MGRFKETRDSVEYLALVTQIGLTMAGSIGLCFAVGYYLDRWLGTKGILLVVFILLGVVGGGATCYHQIMKLGRENPPPEDDSAR